MLNSQRNRELISALLTTLICVLLLLCMLAFGLKKQVPPPPEYGVELNLGNAFEGMGLIQPNDLSEETSQTAVQPTESEENPNIADNSDEITINKTKKPVNKPQVKPTQSNAIAEQPQEVSQPALNPNALYNRKGAKGGSEGTGNIAGDQGDPRGTTGGTAYTGEPGGGGGVSFSLSGRQATRLAKPTYTSDEQGKVVVRIWVNENGVVTRAQAGEQGTNTADASLIKAAETAAMKSTFSVKQGSIPQQGTITYKFVKLN